VVEAGTQDLGRGIEERILMCVFEGWRESCRLFDMNLLLPQERLSCSDSWYFDPAKWPMYRRVIKGAQERGVPFAVGGGFANMAYTGQSREAKDLDLLILGCDRDAMIRITIEAGFQDYYDEKPYDRAWIYRAYRDGVLVDLIWAMANQRSKVDRAWIDQGPEIGVDGVRFRLMPAEELLWIKLYIVQRDRCDWPDALNLLHAAGPDLDWKYVLARLGEDRPLLTALLSMFTWICPDRARQLPDWLWREVGIPPQNTSGHRELSQARANLLDSRPWFVPTIQESQGDWRCRSVP
jgi:hypothetical protein